MAARILKPGDHVRTPTMRLAVVLGLRSDGRRDLAYLDGDCELLTAHPKDLFLVKPSTPLPWRSRLP